MIIPEGTPPPLAVNETIQYENSQGDVITETNEGLNTIRWYFTRFMPFGEKNYLAILLQHGDISTAASFLINWATPFETLSEELKLKRRVEGSYVFEVERISSLKTIARIGLMQRNIAIQDNIDYEILLTVNISKN